MKMKEALTGAETQGIEMIDLGDVVEETRQGSPFPYFPDGCCSYTYLAE